jgi:hypothetical protein
MSVSQNAPADIVEYMRQIVGLCQQREYVAANDKYLRMSIGNAPWPMGVSMAGIHERSGRDRLEEHNVARTLSFLCFRVDLKISENTGSPKSVTFCISRLFSLILARYFERRDAAQVHHVHQALDDICSTQVPQRFEYQELWLMSVSRIWRMYRFVNNTKSNSD